LQSDFFHLLEQKLTDLTLDAAIEEPIIDSKLGNVVRYYRDHIGIDFEAFPCWRKITELRLVANVIKHGEGPSADELRKTNPKMFEYPPLGNEYRIGDPAAYRIRSPLGGEDLYVTADDFKTYESAIHEIFDRLLEHLETNSEKYFPF
jgi:hypothetical protein